LDRVDGRIAKIDGPHSGVIEVTGGLTALFVPRSDFSRGRSENQSLTTSIGFSYDGPRAWLVQSSVPAQSVG
jgi:hypothetical protein